MHQILPQITAHNHQKQKKKKKKKVTKRSIKKYQKGIGMMCRWWEAKNLGGL
jgi:hypothetical protein